MIECPREGYNAVRNRLLDAARAPHLVSLNDDVLPEPYTVSTVYISGGTSAPTLTDVDVVAPACSDPCATIGLWSEAAAKLEAETPLAMARAADHWGVL